MPAADNEDDDSGTDRLITLSDGVMAIALTLLILSIEVPAAPPSSAGADSVSVLWHALGSTLNGWLGYVISFYAIAQFWLIHHRVFRGIRTHRGGLAAWNFVFLFTISVMPFASDLIGKWPENPLSVILFSCNLILADVAIYGMLTYSHRHDLLNDRGLAVLDRYRSAQSLIAIGFYVLAIPVSLFNTTLGKLCWLGLALSSPLGAAIAKRREARAARLRAPRLSCPAWSAARDGILF
jgi:uncharacterized membrane protein